LKNKKKETLSEKLQLLEPKNKAAIRKNWKPKKNLEEIKNCRIWT